MNCDRTKDRSSLSLGFQMLVFSNDHISDQWEERIFLCTNGRRAKQGRGAEFKETPKRRTRLGHIAGGFACRGSCLGSCERVWCVVSACRRVGGTHSTVQMHAGLKRRAVRARFTGAAPHRRRYTPRRHDPSCTTLRGIVISWNQPSRGDGARFAGVYFNPRLRNFDSSM